MNLTQISLSQMLDPSMPTLKHLHVKIVFRQGRRGGNTDPFCGLCIELLKMKNKNVIETIKIEVSVDTDSDCSRGDGWGFLDEVLAQSGWSKLRGVLLAITIWSYQRRSDELERALKRLPQTQFPKLISSESLSFEFSVREWRLV